MSFLLPRRVKDLPPLDTDSDEEFKTPKKDKSNKENEDLQFAANGQPNKTTRNDFTNMRLPKRVSELTLDADSDDEHNLNCAILNDSFITTPTKCDQDNDNIRSLSNDKNPLEFKNRVECTDLLDNFGKIKISNLDTEACKSSSKCQVSGHPLIFENVKAAGSKSVERSSQDATDMGASSKSQHCQPHLEAINENRIIVNAEKPTIALTAKIVKANDVYSHLHTSVEPATQNPKNSVDIQTPFKTNDEQFATPQIRTWSFARKTRDLCSSQSQKTRNAILNECRPQKVLFQTPMALSRAPMANTQNDSITVSLWDSISETNTLVKPENPCHGPEAVKLKTQKSLESQFSGNEGKMKITISNEEIKNPLFYNPSTVCTTHEKVAAAATPSSSSSATAIPVTQCSGDKILTINGAQYAIKKKLGSGGSSSVYLAHRKDIDKEFAIKIVDLRGDSAVIEGYLNETERLAKLQGNQTVITLYEYELLKKESKLIMVMEKGESDLHKILQSYNTHLPLYVLMSFWYQMLQAVNYIHQNGVIHSDLKPANFLMVNGRLKLIDFGIASSISGDSTSIIKYSQAGTFNYISPEALTDTSTGNSPAKNQPKIKISKKSDVWSLGCILYLLLYKKTPFGDIKNMNAKMTAISSPKTEIIYQNIPSFYPIMLVDMAKNCLQHNPKMRPTVAELLRYPFHMVIPLQNLIVPSK